MLPLSPDFVVIVLLALVLLYTVVDFAVHIDTKYA